VVALPRARTDQRLIGSLHTELYGRVVEARAIAVASLVIDIRGLGLLARENLGLGLLHTPGPDITACRED